MLCPLLAERRNSIKSLIIFILTSAIYFTYSNVIAKDKSNDHFCDISLKSISAKKGRAGDQIKLVGVWGDDQEKKRPVINKDGANDLKVISWSKKIIKAKIPDRLKAGNYRIGVYCVNPTKSDGRFQSTKFIDFEIID